MVNMLVLIRPSVPELRRRYAIPIDKRSVQIRKTMNIPNAILETIILVLFAMVLRI